MLLCLVLGFCCLLYVCMVFGVVHLCVFVFSVCGVCFVSIFFVLFIECCLSGGLVKIRCIIEIFVFVCDMLCLFLFVCALLWLLCVCVFCFVCCFVLRLCVFVACCWCDLCFCGFVLFVCICVLCVVCMLVCIVLLCVFV